jgi:MinD superfamily P-loop ATPase
MPLKMEWSILFHVRDVAFVPTSALKWRSPWKRPFLEIGLSLRRLTVLLSMQDSGSERRIQVNSLPSSEKKAVEIAKEKDLGLILIDGPPGIGCPVTASLTGVNLVLAITEPTLSGIHDLERILKLAEHFKIPSMVCINKFDINLENTQQIAAYCKNNGSRLIGQIPYEPKVIEALVNMKTVMEYPCNEVQSIVQRMWEEVENLLKHKD